MEGIEGLKANELEEKIKKRMTLIKKIVEFIEIFTQKIGKRVHYSQGSCHTHIINRAEYKDFTFVSDTGHSMMGGNDFFVWYHPGKKDIDTKRETPVFSVYFQGGIEEVKVLTFDQSPKWLNSLNQIMKLRDKILSKAEKDARDNEARLAIEREKAKKRNALLERAERLKI